MRYRLYKLMRDKDISSQDLAKMLQVYPSAVSHILAGRNNPSYPMIEKLLEIFPDVNPRWLLCDSGPMYETDIPGQPSQATPAVTAENVGPEQTLFPGTDAVKADIGPAEHPTGAAAGTVSASGTEPGFGGEEKAPGPAPAAESGSQKTDCSIPIPVSAAKQTDAKDDEKRNGRDTCADRPENATLKRIVLVYEDNTFETLDRR